MKKRYIHLRFFAHVRASIKNESAPHKIVHFSYWKKLFLFATVMSLTTLLMSTSTDYQVDKLCEETYLSSDVDGAAIPTTTQLHRSETKKIRYQTHIPHTTARMGFSFSGAWDFLTARFSNWFAEEETDNEIASNEYKILADCNITPGNYAPSGTASASSEAFGGFAAAGIDGDITNTNIHHSASETDPWWQVDLGSERTIGEIVFYNRAGQESRADGIIIEILDAVGTVVFTTSYPVAPNVGTIPVPGINGQVVRIRLVGTDRILNFQELEVYGGTLPVSSTIQASCTNGIPNDDAYLLLVNITYGDAFHYSIGNTFDDNGGANTYANAQVISGTTAESPQTIPNPSSSTDYTIRLYNASNTCFEDIVVTLEPQDCSTGCGCTEYVYLNEVANGGAVHKFSVDASGAVTEVGGANGIPWYASINEVPDDRMGSPHGLGLDQNGAVYIGQSFQGNIRKLDCLGNIEPTSEFEIIDGGFNIGTQGNTLYINSYPNSGIQAYDLCSNANQGSINVPGDGDDWGLFVDDDGTFYYTSGFSVSTNNAIVIANPTDADFAANTSYTTTWAADPANLDPSIGDIGVAPSGSLGGITTDPLGNIYVVVQVRYSTFPAQNCSRIYKYSPSGEVLAISTDDCSDDGVGWNQAKGIVYSETCDCLYVSTESEVDDCVYRFNTDLTNTGITGTAVGPVPGGQAKGIAIATECCPTNNRQIIDKIACVADLSEPIYINQLFDCEGTVCEGVWEVLSIDAGLSYDSCEQAISLTVEGCASLTIGSDGASAGNDCGAFEITLNVCFTTLPTAPEIAVTDNDCTAGTPGAFTVTTACGAGSTMEWSTNNGFTWSTTTPTYDAANATIVIARCVSNTENTCVSESTAVTSSPNDCCPNPNCLGITVQQN